MRCAKLIFCLFLLYSLHFAQSKRGGGSRGSSGSRSRSYSSGSGSSKTKSSGSIFGSKGWSLYGAKSSSGSLSNTNPSPQFSSFMTGAGVGYLAGKSTSSRYYFNRPGYPYYYYSSDNNKDICKVEVDVSELDTITDLNAIANENNKTEVYFLCDGSCCETECCEINIGLLIFIIICCCSGLVCICCCCYYALQGDNLNEVKSRFSQRRPTQSQRFADIYSTEGGGHTPKMSNAPAMRLESIEA